MLIREARSWICISRMNSSAALWTRDWERQTRSWDKHRTSPLLSQKCGLHLSGYWARGGEDICKRRLGHRVKGRSKGFKSGNEDESKVKHRTWLPPLAPYAWGCHQLEAVREGSSVSVWGGRGYEAMSPTADMRSSAAATVHHLNAHWKDWCQNWNTDTSATWCKELTPLKKPWCWERLKAGGEGDDRGWDGWMASPTRWTWVWINSGSWWWTGRPGVLQSMGWQGLGHDGATELNCAPHRWVETARRHLNEWAWSGGDP